MTSDLPDVRDRARGALLGAACGDALGAPFEGRPRVQRHQVEQWAGSSAKLEFTDDTAMMIVLVSHLGRNGLRLRQADLALEFAEAWQAEPDRGYGGGPPRIFRAVLNGEDWEVAARTVYGEEGSFGNGGAMRVAPVGLVGGDLSRVSSLAREQAAVTHAHPVGQDGAALQAAAVALALRSAGSALEVPGVLELLLSHVSTPLLAERLDQVHDVLRRAMSPAEVAARLGNDVTAPGSVPTALAMFLRHPDDPAAALLAAVEAGGDADTIAAMTGALSGARCGAASIPAGWRQRLEGGGHLVELADQLMQGVVDGPLDRGVDEGASR